MSSVCNLINQIIFSKRITILILLNTSFLAAFTVRQVGHLDGQVGRQDRQSREYRLMIKKTI
jgi:hypothetical protein